MPAKLPHPRAVDTTGEVPGDLLQWLRTGGGEWLGLVTYQLPFADERHKRIYLERQLVPAYALRPRSLRQVISHMADVSAQRTALP
jgi:hypothetical protein